MSTKCIIDIVNRTLTKGVSIINKERIAAKLRILRGDKSREEVAIACGVTAQAIGMYEQGARIPSDDIKLRLAKVYNRTVQEIFFEE